MARSRIPSYRKHSSGQARVTIGGRDYLLGEFGSAESRREYEQLIAQWMLQGRQAAKPIDSRGISIAELCEAYLTHAAGYYTKDGEPTREVVNIRYALQALLDLHSFTRVADFGPTELKLVRERMIEQQLRRSTINARVSIMQRAFAWAAEEELIDASINHRVAVVRSLRAGQTAVRERCRIGPADDAAVAASNKRRRCCDRPEGAAT